MVIITLITLILAIALLFQKFSKWHFLQLAILALIISSFLIIKGFNIHNLSGGVPLYSGFFHVTTLTQCFDIFLLLLSVFIILPWPLNENQSSNKNTLLFNHEIEAYNNELNFINYNIPSLSNFLNNEYTLFLLFTLLGGSLLMSSSDIISVYLSIELQSFGVYLFSALHREQESSISAALKYYLLGSLSSCFILMGGVLLYSYTGLTQLDNIYSLISLRENSDMFILYDNYLSIFSKINLEQGFLSLQLIDNGINLGLVLILCGFFFKISAAPFHSWAPDVYDGTSTIVTTWLTIIPKLTIFIFLLEFLSGLNISLNGFGTGFENEIYDLMSHFNISSIFTNNSYFENNLMYNMIPELIDNNSFFNFSKIFFNSNLIQNLLLFVSLCSLIIGTVVGLNQIKIKRLLTFSTISHVGFLLLSLSLNTENAVQSFIFYIFQYSLSNLNIFLILLTIGYMNYYKQLSHQKLNYNTLDLYKGKFLNKNKSISDIGLIEEIKGLFYNFPLLCISFSICLFSMAGTPPLIGFFAKQQLLFSTMYSGFYFMSFVVIIVSVISASYYLKLIRVLCFEKPNMNETVRYLDSDYQSLNIKNKSINDDNIINSNLNILFFFNKSKLFINNYHGLAISILTLFILLFIVKSSLFLNSANLIAETSFIC